MTNQLDIRPYVVPLLRWWWLLAAAAITAMIASYIYIASQPAIYHARATIWVGPTVQDSNIGDSVYLSQQIAQTYADVANRAQIRLATQEALGLDWLPYYQVGTVANSQIIEVNVYDQDNQRSFVVAQELVRQIILQGPAGNEEQSRRNFIDQQLIKLEASITKTEDDITLLENELLTTISARDLARKQADIAALQSKLTTLRQNYAELLATTQESAANSLQVLEPAIMPTEPIASDLTTNVLVAAILGLVLAASGAYTIEYLDDTLRDEDEIKKNFGIVVLGSVPAIEMEDHESGAKLITVLGAASAALEAYRVLRTNLQFASIDQPLRLLLVSSPQPEDGKSLTAANLSIALALTGKRVILMDADLHRPSQHKLFKLYNNVGVTTALLANEAGLEQLIQPTSISGLSILTSGPLPPNPAELLGSRRMHEVLTMLKERADIIVIDSPPLTAVSDGIILSTVTDGMIMVLRTGKTRRTATKRALASLAQVHARVLGAVFNGIPGKTGAAMYNYGYYNYAYRRAADNKKRSTIRPEGTAPGIPATSLASNAHAPTDIYPNTPVPDAEGGADEAANNVRHTSSPGSPLHRSRTASAHDHTNGAPRGTPEGRRRSGLPWR
jgi:non-specific protein-tyrosine kinase